jgi:hypothetical protein
MKAITAAADLKYSRKRVHVEEEEEVCDPEDALQPQEEQVKRSVFVPRENLLFQLSKGQVQDAYADTLIMEALPFSLGDSPFVEKLFDDFAEAVRKHPGTSFKSFIGGRTTMTAVTDLRARRHVENYRGPFEEKARYVG